MKLGRNLVEFFAARPVVALCLVALLAAAVFGSVPGSETVSRDRYSGRSVAPARGEFLPPDPAGCTDQDGDGFCDTEDCDDTNPHCAVSCTDTDGDGVCDDQDNCVDAPNPNQGTWFPIGGTTNVGVSYQKFTPDSSTVIFRSDHAVPGTSELYSVLFGGQVPPTKLNLPVVPGGDVGFAQLTPDGSIAVHTAETEVLGRNELYSVPVAGGTPIKLSVPVHGTWGVWPGVRLTPDGTTAVYQGDTNFRPDLYAVPVTGGPSTQLNEPLTGSTGVTRFRISADGSTVIYLADRDVDQVMELFSVPIGGGPSTKLNAPLVAGGDVNFRLLVTPDSATAIYIADQDTDEVLEIFSVPIGGGTPVKLNGPITGDGVLESAVTGDSATVVYLAEQDSENDELFSVPAGGGAATKLNGPMTAGMDVLEYSVVDDTVSGNTYVVYRADQEVDEVDELYSVPVGGGTSVKLNGPLVFGGDVGKYTFSPDGATVVYLADEEVNGERALYRVPVGGGARTRMTVQPAALDFEVTSDGTKLVYEGWDFVTLQWFLYVVPMAGGPATKLNGPLAGSLGVTDFVLSPDGSRVVYRDYTDNPGLSDTGEVYGAPVSDGIDVDGDGFGAACDCDDDKPECVVDCEDGDGDGVPICEGDCDDTNPDCFLDCNDTDGDGVCDGRDNCIDIPNPIQGVPTPLSFITANGGDVYPWQISPDGSRVVFRADYVANRWELWSAPVEGGSLTKLSPDPHANDVWFGTWITPDSSTVIWQANHDDAGLWELYRAPIDGGPIIKLNPPFVGPEGIENFNMTPDGSSIVYVADQDSFDVLEMYSVPVGGGAATKLNPPLSPGGEVHQGIYITGDSATVVYRADLGGTGDFELYSVPVGGGASTTLNEPLVGGSVATVRMSPDGTTVVYRAAQDTFAAEIYAVPATGGATVKLNGPLVAGGSVWTYGISPDSSTVVYLADQDTDEVFELFSVPIGGGPAVKLNAPLVAGGEIDPIYFTVTPDGSTLIYRADQDTGGVTELYSVPIGGGAVTKLNPPLGVGRGVAEQYRISPDSATVLYLSDQEIDDYFELYAVPTSGGAAVKLNHPSHEPQQGRYEVLPDNATVFYVANPPGPTTTGLYSVPIGGGEPLRLNPPDDHIGGTGAVFAWTPDVSRVIHRHGPNLYSSILSDGLDVDGDGYGIACDCSEEEPDCAADCTLCECTNADGDGFCEEDDCDDSDPDCSIDCSDGDGDGFCEDLDCNDSLPQCTVDCTDTDGDQYCAAADCDDTRPNCTVDCTDGDGDDYCVPQDCDDSSPSCSTDCTDADGDGLRACDGDCDDTLPECTLDCTDTDGDGYCLPQDCDDTLPNCTVDCTDVDGDGYCIPQDCDDGNPDCATGCTDGDGDGVAGCAGDCDDTNPNCLTDCTDGDGDQYCAPEDCDDTLPNCTVDCTDGDGDDYCLPQDCDDDSPACTTDCNDSDGDGVSICEGDCDDANPNCTFDCTDTDGDLFCPPFDCDDTKFHCIVDCTDDDGDGWCIFQDCDDGDPACMDDCADADFDGLRACNGDCDDTRPHCLFDCTDNDGDDYCAPQDCDDSVNGCSIDCADADGDGVCADLDCDDGDPDCVTGCVDVDGDGVRACNGDCDDTNPNCRLDCTDGDSDGYCVDVDCDDGLAACSVDCSDSDGDGFCADADCDDENVLCQQDCFDLDDDGACADFDCDEFNANCTTDCTDADGDGFCVTHDCDDAVAACTIDCTDADEDGLRICDGDCDDSNGNCTTDCTDGDGDGFCVLQDCDDGSAACNVSCVDADGDGVRVCDGDCNDGNPLCTVDCTDVDGDGVCIPQDCDDGDVDCALDCTDDDGDGLWACQGDCDDENPNALPGLPEVCADDADNDCNGLTDGEEPFCADLETSNLLMAQNSPATLSWDPAVNADAYAVYRGKIPRTGFAGYNHVCEATLLTGTTATDPDVPRRGEGFYYLVTGLSVQSELLGGPLGTATSGASRLDSDSITCGPRVYVDPDNLAGPNDGLSWATAYTSLSDAVKHAPYDNRGSEIWIRSGLIEGGAFASVADRPGARILGGFNGTENGAWERPAEGPPTVVDRNGFGSVFWVAGMSLVLERMTLQDAGTGVLAQPSGALLELSGITTRQISGYGVDLGDVGPTPPRLVIEDSVLDATGGLGGLRAVSEGDTLSGLVRGNTISGGSDAGMRIEALAGNTDATVALDIIANTITGGATGMVLGARVGPGAADLVATQESFVASNLIHGTSGHAVIVEAVGTILGPQDSVVSRPLLVGNTLSDGGGAGLRSSASRSGSGGDVRAEPQLWDNLITFHAGPGVEETADDEPNGVVADPLVVGNDLFGNLSLYRDEGATDLTLIDDVNLLTGAYDNYDEDPGYRDRPSDDYHLSIGTVLGIGSSMVYLPNQSDPGIGMGWTGSFDDSSWDPGAYGIGYDTGPPPNAQNLILTAVPVGTLSIYTRVTFDIDDVDDVIALTFGSDHDDGVVAWINGVEVFRSASMPADPLLWNSSPTEHESSNNDTPVYEEHDVSTLGIPALQTGPNVLAVGVWNTDAGSDDLVLVPRLIVNQEFPPIDAGHLEAPRLATEDIDGGPRVLDGLRDFLGRPDTGADERQ